MVGFLRTDIRLAARGMGMKSWQGILLHIVNGIHTLHATRLLLQAGWMMFSAGGDTLTAQIMTSEQRLWLRDSTTS